MPARIRCGAAWRRENLVAGSASMCTKHVSLSLSLSLSLYVCIYLSLSLYIYIYIHTCIYLSPSLSLYTYIYIYICYIMLYICYINLVAGSASLGPAGCLHYSCKGFTIISTMYVSNKHNTSFVCSAAHVVILFVSSEVLKCRLLKWSLEHPINSAIMKSVGFPNRGFLQGNCILQSWTWQGFLKGFYRFPSNVEPLTRNPSAQVVRGGSAL